MRDDEKVLLGRVAEGLEAVVREQTTFRQETKTELATMNKTLASYGIELAEHRGARGAMHRKSAAIAAVAAAAITAVGHIVVRFVTAAPSH